MEDVSIRVRTALSNQIQELFKGQLLIFQRLKITEDGSAIFSFFHKVGCIISRFENEVANTQEGDLRQIVK